MSELFKHPIRCLCLAISLAGAVSASADEHENAELAQAAAIGALGGTNFVTTIAALVPTLDPFTGLALEGISFTSNLALKGMTASMIEPDDIFVHPNVGSCNWNPELDQHAALYVDAYGVPLKGYPASGSPADWGLLGQPEVYHWDTHVVLSALSQHIDPGALNSTHFPQGTHPVNWQAQTLIDPFFDIALPAAMLAFSYSKFKAAKTAPAAAAKNAAAAAEEIRVFQLAAKWVKDKLNIVTKPWSKCSGNTGCALARKGLIKGASAVYKGTRDNTGLELPATAVVSRHKTHQQVVTVYDTLDPVIAYGNVNNLIADGGQMPQLVLEATDFGGVAKHRVIDALREQVYAYDTCDRTASLTDDIPELIPLGGRLYTWTSRDMGPNLNLETNAVSATQTIVVRDTQGPIMITPPGKVVEIDPGATQIAASEVNLGSPRVVDLADPAPLVGSTAPEAFAINSRTPVTWTATDASGNASSGEQLITVKAFGTNTPPTVQDVFAQTLTSDPVDVVLSGADADLLDGVFDPLSIQLESRPQNGDFVAPLLPYFIEDYRTLPSGPLGEDFALQTTLGARLNWLWDNRCDHPDYASLPSTERIPRDWPYAPKFILVEDGGDYYLTDAYFTCDDIGQRARINYRLSKWNADNELLGVEGSSDSPDFNHFVIDNDGYLYRLTTNGTGNSTSMTLTQHRTGTSNFAEFMSDVDSWKFDFASSPGVSIDPQNLSYARVDSGNGLLYLNDGRRIFVYDIRGHLADGVEESDTQMRDHFLGALRNGERVLCNINNTSGNTHPMAIDSDGYLYVGDRCDNRIHKFAPSGFNAENEFVPGDYIGWMGRCDTNLQGSNACDEDNQRSRGFACTDATCYVPDRRIVDGKNINGSQGEEPGQFTSLTFIDLDPNDILYISDLRRVQRFAPDGTFGGEARSTGTGINQGDRPGFILGNMGTVRAVTVNSRYFYVVDQAESFIHVFETTPLKDITDNSATVSYVSNFNFHGGTDTFTFSASDGLHRSNIGTATVQVDRNFRPPVAFEQSLVVDEDSSGAFTLEGDDPDGVIGTIDVYPLDNLDFIITEQPANGTITGTGANRIYTPNPDFHGTDQFTFVANDGVLNSEPVTVDVTVNWMDDLPQISLIRLPERIPMGYPVAITVEYEDDGYTQAPVPRIEWVAGSEIDELGGFVDPDGPEGPQKPELIGVDMTEPPNGEGTGFLMAEHVYQSPGVKLLRICIDTSPAEVCHEQTVLVEELVHLAVQFFGEEVETSAPYLDVPVSVFNSIANPTLFLSAYDVNINQVAVPELRTEALFNETTSLGTCTLTNGAMNCQLDELPVAHYHAPTLRIAPAIDGPQIYDIGAPLSVDVTSSTETTKEVYTQTRWLRFLADPTDTDNDGMTDVYETVYGLDINDPSDAQLDSDGDRLTNLEEYEARTNPTNADTDGDMVPDNEDFCPLDPGGVIEGTNGLCEEDIRTSPVLRILRLLAARQPDGAWHQI